MRSKTETSPTGYRDDLCDTALKYMAEGHSTVAFAGATGFSRATLDAWAGAHPEFARALTVGRAKAVTFWEQKLAEIARSGEGNASAAIFGLKNARTEWTSAEGDDAPQQTLSDLELARRIAHILELGEEAKTEGQE